MNRPQPRISLASAARVRQKPQGRNKGIIHLSGWIDKKDAEELTSKGIECIGKGRAPQELIDVVEGFFA